MLAPEGGRERSGSCSVSLQTDVDTQTERLDVFECNICLDSAQEPVVTFCGHLYCWPCIYKWLECSAEPACPVCKAAVSPRKLVPVYGRGKPHLDPRTSLGGSASADAAHMRQIPSRPHSRRPEAHRRGGGSASGGAAEVHDAQTALPALGGVPVSLLAYARERRRVARPRSSRAAAAPVRSAPPAAAAGSDRRSTAHLRHASQLPARRVSARRPVWASAASPLGLGGLAPAGFGLHLPFGLQLVSGARAGGAPLQHAGLRTCGWACAPAPSRAFCAACRRVHGPEPATTARA